MRTGICTVVYSGDEIGVDGGFTKLRYHNVWAPEVGTAFGDATTQLNRDLVLGKEVQYEPTGYLHWDNVGIVSEVFVGDVWVNQEIRYWLAKQLAEKPQQLFPRYPGTR